MGTTDYVSYDLALKLKACGFDEPCDHYYTPNKTFHIVKSNALAPEITNNRFLDEIADGCCAAVPLWQAQKWMREKKGIYAYCEPNCLKKWFARAIDLTKNEDLLFDGEMFDNFEKATEYAISAALELIKEGE